MLKIPLHSKYHFIKQLFMNCRCHFIVQNFRTIAYENMYVAKRSPRSGRDGQRYSIIDEKGFLCMGLKVL